MDLTKAQAALDQVTALVADLQTKSAAKPDDEGLKAQLAAAQDRQATAKALVDALTRAHAAEGTIDEQARTIERLSTTRSTTQKREDDVRNAGGGEPFAEELKEIQDLATTDPGAAASKMAALMPKMRQSMSDAAVNNALHATKIYIDNRQLLDSVKSDPNLQHLLPFEASIRSRVIVLTNEGKSLKDAFETAKKEAQALYDAGKKAAEPAQPPRPAPGAQGAPGGGTPPPPTSPEPKLPSPSEELATRETGRKNKATAIRSLK